ncbi:hypothetical protein [Gymnodinialimonas ceratoperidinii]|uniref:Uncharacterized protein n=1 Tax=Gymnodinialimonas ceratoperidinii TaxID=2856823 RepID=A0A8F6TUN9_9RHOB|nr:hypothetical protein [Gymnodinialimonas ceratoperidinii]QXT39050.1 hypothetical protein KYE46_14085 [Gymnodinialimonas ceratoperidinii]
MTDDTPTSSKLRRDIDAGKAGDKVGFPDPAAAPLGTDAEAGGTPPTDEELRVADEHEIDNRPDGQQIDTEPRPVSMERPEPARSRGGIFFAVVLGILIIGFAIYAFA